MVTSWNWLYLTDFTGSFKPKQLNEANPANFSYYFDQSGRRTCYIAPERFVPKDNLVNDCQGFLFDAILAKIKTPNMKAKQPMTIDTLCKIPIGVLTIIAAVGSARKTLPNTKQSPWVKKDIRSRLAYFWVSRFLPSSIAKPIINRP